MQRGVIQRLRGREVITSRLSAGRSLRLPRRWTPLQSVRTNIVDTYRRAGTRLQNRFERWQEGFAQDLGSRWLKVVRANAITEIASLGCLS